MSNHDKVLAKVRALLDQAEATDYEEEAHAFISGAERLMAKYGIEEALVLAAGKPIEDTIGFRRFYVCLLYTSPSPRDQRGSRMPSSA